MYEGLQGEAWLHSRQKRLIDIAFVVSLTPAIVPSVAAGAMAFSIESRINPLFIQERHGKGAEIKIPKLRTMATTIDYSDGGNGPRDERASKVGRLLRLLSIDELPQAALIAAGKMSVVGPRPIIKSEVNNTLDELDVSEQREWLRARSVCKPGLISEFGNLAHNLTSQDDGFYRLRAEKDILYAEEASAKKDMQIIRQAVDIGRNTVRIFMGSIPEQSEQTSPIR